MAGFGLLEMVAGADETVLSVFNYSRPSNVCLKSWKMIAGFIVFASPPSYIINQPFFILPTETSMVFWVVQADSNISKKKSSIIVLVLVTYSLPQFVSLMVNCYQKSGEHHKRSHSTQDPCSCWVYFFNRRSTYLHRCCLIKVVWKNNKNPLCFLRAVCPGIVGRFL